MSMGLSRVLTPAPDTARKASKPAIDDALSQREHVSLHMPGGQQAWIPFISFLLVLCWYYTFRSTVIACTIAFASLFQSAHDCGKGGGSQHLSGSCAG